MRKDVESYSDLRAAIKRHSGEELDIKPYEADMRHLLNTYIQADPAADLGELAEMSLTELIIETGRCRIGRALSRSLRHLGAFPPDQVTGSCARSGAPITSQARAGEAKKTRPL